MRPLRARAIGLLTALLLLAPVVLAQADDIRVDVMVRGGSEEVNEVGPGQFVQLFANVTTPEHDNRSWRAFLNGTVDGGILNGTQQLSSDGGTFDLFIPFTVPDDAEGNVTVRYEVSVQSLNGTDPNATWVEEAMDAGSIVLSVPAPPEPPGPPVGLIVGAVGIVLLAVVAVVVLRRRPKQIQAAPRSRALQEIQREEDARKRKRPAEEAVVTQTPRIHPQVKILEARAADVRRLIDLAKQRHERGEITEHQFKMIRDRKEAELQRIHEEMESYRDEGA